ncbi:MAG: T9SS type A sorting domain-containing protein [Bacteroidota bacterium]
MKIPVSVLLIFFSVTLCGQETITLGQDIMGTFTSGDTECYELTIEEAGEYVLTYNLWDATMSVMNPDQQQIFNDYMTIFEPSPRSQELTLNMVGTYQICFHRGAGETAMYQCRIAKKTTGPDEPVPVEFGEYILEEIYSPITYSFDGQENAKIRIGIGGIFSATLKITAPSENVIYEQSFEIPPEEGIKEEFTLEESGEYLISITPLVSTLVYTFTICLLEPVEALPVQFNESYGGTLGNFGNDYYRFDGLDGYNLLVSFSGSTEGVSVQVVTPAIDTIVCNDTIDEVHIAEILNIEEDGTYLIIISADLQGANVYSMNVAIMPDQYIPGTLIIKESAPHYRNAYSFTAGQDDILRMGLDLPSKVLELKDPGGDIIFSLYDTLSANTETALFEEITLDDDGEYIITVWHTYTENSPIEMKFCASIVPHASLVEKDRTYQISVPPYQRLPFFFNAEATEVVRLGFPSGTSMLTPGGDTVVVSYGEAFMLPQTGSYSIDICNFTTDQQELEIWVNTEIPPQEIPFGTTVDYEVSGIYTCNVPADLEQLFVIVKKNNTIGYDDTWYGDLTLRYGDLNWQRMLEEGPDRDDFIFQIKQPGAGLYQVPVFTEDISEEAYGSILFTEHLPGAQMNKWSTGIINRAYGSDWKTFSIDSQADTLFFMTEGFGLWSSLYISYDSINNPEQHWIFRNNGQGFNIEGKILNAPPGRYYVRYIDSAVLQESDEGFYNHSEDQTRTYLLYVGSALSENTGILSLRELSAYQLGTGPASITISGSGLSEVNSVNLISQDGQSTISMDIQNVTDDGGELVATYDFSNVEPGTYQMEVQGPDTLISYGKTIEILPEMGAAINGTLLTSNLYRLGRKQQVIITVRNSGSIDIPYAIGYFYTTSDEVGILVTDTPPSDYPADSVNTLLQQEIITRMPFFIENLKVGGEITLIFKIFSSTFPGNESFQVGYEVGNVDEDTYYSVRSSLASDLYHSMITSDAITESMKWYLGELTLERFIDVCNGKDDGELSKFDDGYESTKQNIVTATDLSMSWLSFAAGKALPFSDNFNDFSETFTIMSNPWAAAKKIVGDTRDAWLDAADKMREILKKMPAFKRESTKTAVNSTTPEDKYGPVGYGTETGIGYIDSLRMFEYRIDYWNKEDATAPAAIVYIRDTIDTDFDLKTLRFTEFGFLKWKVKLDGGQYFNVNVDCRPDMPYIVNVEGTVDHNSREVYWVHTTLDPATMDLPDDPMSGYLPPIDSTGYQIGWVNYTISPDGELKHDASFENQAFVNFDGVGAWGPAPPDGPYTSIFDFIPPSSYVETLNPVQTELIFSINLNGEDQGSGIGYFNIYVSKDYEEAYLWKKTDETTLEFTGEDGARYEFHSIATDRVGNTEEMKGVYDTYTVVEADLTGIEQPRGDTVYRLQLLPNPNDGIFRILIDGFSGKGFLKIADPAGRIIYEKEHVAGEYINLNHLHSGLYLLYFRSNNGNYYSKLLIN